jgi:hypothetical protein
VEISTNNVGLCMYVFILSQTKLNWLKSEAMLLYKFVKGMNEPRIIGSVTRL